MNLEKHVKNSHRTTRGSGGQLVPTHARGAHLVDRYIKGRKADHQSNRRTVLPAAPQYILRFDRLPSTPTSLARIRQTSGGDQPPPLAV